MEEAKIEFEFPFAYPDYFKATCFITNEASYIRCVNELLKYTLDVDHIELPATAPSYDDIELDNWEAITDRTIKKGLPCPQFQTLY